MGIEGSRPAAKGWPRFRWQIDKYLRKVATQGWLLKPSMRGTHPVQVAACVLKQQMLSTGSGPISPCAIEFACGTWGMDARSRWSTGREGTRMGRRWAGHRAQYNVEATGHVAKLRRDLSV